MKFLLDTHILLWWWTAPQLLREKEIQAIASLDHTIYISSISSFEIANKYRLGKLILPPDFLLNFPSSIRDEGWAELPVTSRHTLLGGQLESPHRDPFDRLLAAQALSEQAILITRDDQFRTFPQLQLQI